MKRIKDLDGDLCEFDVQLLVETDKALKVNDGVREAWLPKSQLAGEIEHLDNGLVRIIVPEWLAMDKELI
jgi:hypothetical protein